MISELGFFSPEATDSKGQIRQQYRGTFDTGEQITRLLIPILRDAELDPTSTKNMAVNALAAKGLELFQSSQLLLERGCIPAAKVVSRALIETCYKLCAIHLSPEGINHYTQQAAATRLQKLKSVQRYKQKHGGAGIAPGIEAEIKTLTDQKPPRLEQNQWASLAQMDDFHNIYYQGLSDDVHANIESLNHYCDESSEHMMNFGPSDKDLLAVAAASQRTMLSLIEKYAQHLKQDVTGQLAALNKSINAIEERHDG
jgi:hypothetical protein